MKSYYWLVVAVWLVLGILGMLVWFSPEEIQQYPTWVGFSLVVVGPILLLLWLVKWSFLIGGSLIALMLVFAAFAQVYDKWFGPSRKLDRVLKQLQRRQRSW